MKKDIKEIILEHIPSEPCGKHHSELANELGMTKVEFRDFIRILRNEGYAICSNPKDGYWIARNAEELQSVIDMFSSYIKSMQKTVNALEITKKELGGL